MEFFKKLFSGKHNPAPATSSSSPPQPSDPQPPANSIAATHRSIAEHFAETITRITQGQYPLDFTQQSLENLESFQAAPNFAGDLGCYVGEVIIRTLGGQWEEDGALRIYHPQRRDELLATISPISKARKRMTHGKEDNLAFFVQAIADNLKEMENRS
jgi:hypothetical protein